MAILPPKQQPTPWKGYNGILPPKGWGSIAAPVAAPNIVTPNTLVPGGAQPAVTQPVNPTTPTPTPQGPITLDNPYAPTSGGGSTAPDTSSPDWLSYWRSTQAPTTAFGALGGLGNNSFPTRYVAPESQQVANDGELDYLLGNWVTGRKQDQANLQNVDVNALAAQRGFVNFGTKYGANYDFGVGQVTGPTANIGIGQAAGLGALQTLDPWLAAANNGDVAQVGGQTYNLGNFIDANRQGILGSIAKDSAAINADIAAKQAEHKTIMAGRQQNQLTQQQAYNSMGGNGSANGLLTQAYSMPGFGQVTGQATDATLGQQVGNSAALAGSGVFDPAIQSGVYGQALVNTPWRL